MQTGISPFMPASSQRVSPIKGSIFVLCRKIPLHSESLSSAEPFLDVLSEKGYVINSSTASSSSSDKNDKNQDDVYTVLTVERLYGFLCYIME